MRIVLPRRLLTLSGLASIVGVVAIQIAVLPAPAYSSVKPIELKDGYEGAMPVQANTAFSLNAESSSDVEVNDKIGRRESVADLGYLLAFAPFLLFPLMLVMSIAAFYRRRTTIILEKGPLLTHLSDLAFAIGFEYTVMVRIARTGRKHAFYPILASPGTIEISCNDIERFPAREMDAFVVREFGRLKKSSKGVVERLEAPFRYLLAFVAMIALLVLMELDWKDLAFALRVSAAVVLTGIVALCGFVAWRGFVGRLRERRLDRDVPEMFRGPFLQALTRMSETEAAHCHPRWRRWGQPFRRPSERIDYLLSKRGWRSADSEPLHTLDDEENPYIVSPHARPDRIYTLWSALMPSIGFAHLWATLLFTIPVWPVVFYERLGAPNFWAVLIACVLILLTTDLLLDNVAKDLGLSLLTRKMRRMRDMGGKWPPDRVVAIAPCGLDKLYSGGVQWDIGFADCDGAGLVFESDVAAFAIAWRDVTGVRLERRQLEAIPTYWVSIEWSNCDGKLEHLSFCCIERLTRIQNNRATKHFFTSFRNAYVEADNDNDADPPQTTFDLDVSTEELKASLVSLPFKARFALTMVCPALILLCGYPLYTPLGGSALGSLLLTLLPMLTYYAIYRVGRMVYPQVMEETTR